MLNVMRSMTRAKAKQSGSEDSREAKILKKHSEAMVLK